MDCWYLVLLFVVYYVRKLNKGLILFFNENRTQIRQNIFLVMNENL